MSSNPVCWIVTEGMAGTENQCLGIAEALGVLPQVKRINLRQPWKSLSPYLGLECACTFTGDDLKPPWPGLVLASGRKAVAAARYIKKASNGKSFVVVIQDPRVAPSQFDLVAVPAHDPTRGENVIVTSAAPNRITAARLEEARIEFDSLLSALPRPRVAVMIGGNSKAYKMTADVTRKLAADLKTLAESGYGLMITASRRTGVENDKILRDILRPPHPTLPPVGGGMRRVGAGEDCALPAAGWAGAKESIFYWDGHSPNPYFGFLAWADFILVTADSVSMISEAATTGKPVYMIPLEGGTARLNAFHDNLMRQGVIRRFEGLLDSYDYSPLDDAGLVAAEIRKHLNK